MNIKHALWTILLGSTIITTTAQDISTQTINSEQQWKNWFTPYATPCIAGGIIGSVSGKISAHMIRLIVQKILLASMLCSINPQHLSKPEELPNLLKISGLNGLVCISAIIGTLVAENKLRAKCINSLNQSFENYGIQHNNNITTDSARIFSWLSFLRIMA